MRSDVKAGGAVDWFKSIKRWTAEKVLQRMFKGEAATHILHHKNLFFPINVNGTHWVLLHIMPSRRMVHIYDSILSVVFEERIAVLTAPDYHSRIFALAKHWVDEQIRTHDRMAQFRSQEFKFFDSSKWKFETVTQCPQQRGSFDCGVFVCMFVRYLALGYPLDFTAADMGNIRIAMACEIKRLSFEMHQLRV